LDPFIRAFELLIRGDMSASDIPSLTIYRNQRYLTPELESLIRDFAYTYSAEIENIPLKGWAVPEEIGNQIGN
jgi:hypothetical protein